MRAYLPITLFIVLSVSVLVLAGCSSPPASPDPAQQPITGNAAAVPLPSAGPLKEFTMTAKDWSFEPSAITVNKGDHVRITITSLDVNHGFSLPDFGVNAFLAPGKPAVADFVADKAGTFGFRCNVPCGEGHRTMTGTITVI